MIYHLGLLCFGAQDEVKVVNKFEQSGLDFWVVLG
jgi:hypothetical protein